ncbi:MAG: tetratricopeptide repeat protein [Archangium sp.]
MRALRAENARLESRVEKLESEKMLAGIRAPAPKPAAMSARPSPQSSADALPPLAVVKLKPKREAPPKLDTSVAVNEPEEAVELYTDQNNPLTKASSPSQPNAEPDEADLAMADAQFERGLEMMKTGNGESGVAQMQQFVSDWPRHPKADNALYFAGLALAAEKDFEKASGLFERVLAQYPAGDAVLDSMLKLADCRQRLNKTREARATWEKIVTNYPGTAAATQAQARLSSASASTVATP